MCAFWDKKAGDEHIPDEIETLQARLAKAESRLRAVESSLIDVTTTIDILRNKVLRKIQKVRGEDEDEVVIIKKVGQPVKVKQHGQRQEIEQE